MGRGYLSCVSHVQLQRARIHGGGGSMPSLQAIDSTPPGPSIDMQVLCVHAHVHVHVHVHHVHSCVHVHVHVAVCMYIHTYKCECVCMHA